MQSSSKVTIGKMSLCFSILGLLLPMAIAFYVYSSVEGYHAQQFYFLSYFLFLILQITAFITGINSYSHVFGKIGLAISVFCNIITVFALFYFGASIQI